MNPDEAGAAAARHSKMGIGATVLGAIAWASLVVSFVLAHPHELGGLGLVFAISGVAVARDARGEENTRARFKRVGMFVSLGAIIGILGAIAWEMARVHFRR
jgi:hypothetical protein